MEIVKELQQLIIGEDEGELTNGFCMKLRFNEGFDIDLYKEIVIKLREANKLFREDKLSKTEYLEIITIGNIFYCEAINYQLEPNDELLAASKILIDFQMTFGDFESQEFDIEYKGD